MRLCRGLTLALVLLSSTLGAHEQEPVQRPVVIDTDVGIDDVVALALALQAPELELAGVVTTAGAATPTVGQASLERLLDLYNRHEVPLWAPLEGSSALGDVRIHRTVEKALSTALPDQVQPWARPFSPAAYEGEATPPTVLVLGPLSTLATALERAPDLGERLSRVVVAGRPDPRHSWNLRADLAAYEKVRAAGVAMTFVVPDEQARKPLSWRAGGPVTGRATSPAQTLLQRLFAPPALLDHYLDRLGPLHDELAVLYVLHPELFVPGPEPDTVIARNHEELLTAFDRLLRRGRQPRHRVVLTAAPVPASLLREDVQAIRSAAIAAHGEDEFFAQLLLNELHEHLGAYSIIGVKMGLRAAELLNAPPHTMQVVSAVAARPPVSCLNDGVMVATGATPGRGLFRHQPGKSDAVSVTFSSNGRSVVLTLREEYRQRVATELAHARADHGLEDPAYWAEVRRFGLEIWRDWHRLDLFATSIVVPTPTTASTGGSS